MTTQAERIREAHRGFRRAEPASRSRLKAIETFGLSYRQVDDFNVIVEGQYQLNLAMSFWRAIDGSSQGYLVTALDAQIKRDRNLAGGRDSVAVHPDQSGKPNGPAIAESPARPVERSASLLPEVRP